MARDGPDPSWRLQARHLRVSLSGRLVLADLTFSVESGTILAVVGPNGSGKTVLFRALIGAVPFTGEVLWAARSRLGYVPQKLDIERDVPVTGLDFLRAHPRATRTHSPEMTAALGQVGLGPEVARRPIGQLSGGQFQRLLIAFALVGQPNVLLLDEPTAGIDEPGGERLYEFVHRLRHEQGTTVLVITHELTVVSRYADNVLCLGAGHSWFGPPTAVLTQDVIEEAYGMRAALHLHDH